MPNQDTNFFLMFGRLEGKVDALLSNQSRTDARLDEVETRLSDIETAKATGLGIFKTVHLVWMLVAACAAFFTDELKSIILGR